MSQSNYCEKHRLHLHGDAATSCSRCFRERHIAGRVHPPEVISCAAAPKPDHSGDANEMVQQDAKKECRACKQSGMVHCAHPDECGGPWSEPVKQQEAPELTDKEIAMIACAEGQATECDGYKHNTLWFNGNLTDFARVVIAADRAKRGGA